MNTSNQVMAWGEEITPLEMQNTKGGGIMEILIGIGLIDYLVRLWDGQSASEALNGTLEDGGKVINFLLEIYRKLNPQ
jgi:hypothetical protein